MVSSQRSDVAPRAPWRSSIPREQTMLDTVKPRSELGYIEVIRAADQIAETVAWLDANPPATEGNVGFVDPFDYEREDRLVASYRAAMVRVHSEAGWDAPPLHHPLPHPKSPHAGPDERGR